jgi:hypothetical protein
MPDFEERSHQIPPEELERYRDAEWALRDPEVQRKYEGQCVVAYQRAIIAHGPDAQAVAEQARQIVPGQIHRVVFCAPDDPDAWFQHGPDMSMDFTDG